jgi:hypothetical protein
VGCGFAGWIPLAGETSRSAAAFADRYDAASIGSHAGLPGFPNGFVRGAATLGRGAVIRFPTTWLGLVRGVAADAGL